MDHCGNSDCDCNFVGTREYHLGVMFDQHWNNLFKLRYKNELEKYADSYRLNNDDKHYVVSNLEPIIKEIAFLFYKNGFEDGELPD